MTLQIQPRRLAGHAQTIANHHRAGGRPIVTWLRRSMSASYYAVFHAVALAVADQISGSASAADRHRLTRSVGHRSVADVCRWLTGSGHGRKHSAPIIAELRANPALAEFADAFLNLQQARHEADYDHLAEIRKASALAHHEHAVRALDLLDTLRRTTDGERFLALVALHTSLT